jgi:indolepyruvate ferredoxin oxidoreductase beta subunit
MQNRVTNVCIAGLGGQGVLTASDILAHAAFSVGLDVKKSEVHGMSQRGGSVCSDIRFGPSVLSPMIASGEADHLVVVAPDQVECNAWRLRPEGKLYAPTLLNGVPLENPRSVNLALLGALSRHLDLSPKAWHDAIRARLKPSLVDLNLRAFDLGRALPS